MKTTIIFTSLLLGCGLLFFNTHQSANTVTSKKTFKRADAGDGPVGAISIIIDKSDYELSVYDEKGWFATYPVVFGNNSLDDKKMEGDKKTPEGSFKIANKRIHEKWYRFLSINYPTKESWDKFNERKKRGEIPANASIGGGVGIHGTWPKEDFIIDKYKNWTLGCISMKKDHILEIYDYTPVGTPVVIRK
jgi:murein L,D-transpeptidase YafK